MRLRQMDCTKEGANFIEKKEWKRMKNKVKKNSRLYQESIFGFGMDKRSFYVILFNYQR